MGIHGVERAKLKDRKILNSTHNSCLALISMLKTFYKNMPFLMITFTFILCYLAEKFGRNSTFQLVILTTIILISSIVVYFRYKNYGEAVLALSAGLFTVYTVNWSPSRFISFIIVWIMFTIVIFLITSIKLSSTVESIYLEATLAIKNADYSSDECKKKLQAISDSLEDSIMGPVERAETIKLFAYRKMPLSEMQIGLKWVNIFFSLTGISYLTLADFVAVVIKNASILNSKITVEQIFDYIYSGMEDAPVTPQEYIEMFQKTRHFLIRYKNIVLYFNTLNSYFNSGISPNDIEIFFRKHYV